MKIEDVQVGMGVSPASGGAPMLVQSVDEDAGLVTVSMGDGTTAQFGAVSLVPAQGG